LLSQEVKEMQYKTIELKADEVGKVAGFFSTYDKTPDSYGDIIEPGAFTETLEKRKATGHPFPLCLNHDFSDVIGSCDSIEEKEKGPFVEASLFDTGRAQEVRTWLKSGAIYQFSFAYDVLQRRDPTEEEKKAGVMNVLQKIELFEVSIVTVPANQNAVVTEVKSVEPETKAGKRNSKKDADVINQIIALAQSLLDEPEDKPTEDEEKSEEAQPEVNEASEEPKSESNSKRADELLEKINSLKGGS
jgi:HK97 family phage prohead protease